MRNEFSDEGLKLKELNKENTNQFWKETQKNAFKLSKDFGKREGEEERALPGYDTIKE